MENKIMWAVDFPNPNNLDDSWINIDFFDTRKEAIQWVVEKAGIPKKHASLFVSKVPR
jgi:hypothetical protein